MKATLRKEESKGCIAKSPSGKHTIEVKHGIEYDFLYDGNEGFYLVVDDRIYKETSTAFDFVETKGNQS